MTFVWLLCTINKLVEHTHYILAYTLNNARTQRDVDVNQLIRLTSNLGEGVDNVVKRCKYRRKDTKHIITALL